jgi:phage gp37-like protein
MAVNRLNVGATNQLLAKASTGQSTNILELQNTAGVTVAGVDASGNPVGGLVRTPAFKNLVINGDMQVAQRGTSVASITTNNYYTVDRFRLNPGSLGTWTMSVENDAPTGSGFRKSTKILCTTADASPAAGDYLSLNQPIEGQNLQQIAKGTSSAKQLTLSFWVKANVTGTYIVDLYDNDNNRVVSGSYSISASATWEKKTVTFAADTTGAFDNDNAASLYIEWWLGAGSNYTTGTLATSWQSYTAANVAVGQTNLAASTNNYWQITGVQLEVGSTATDFEFLPADVELAQCQRYYERLTSGNTFGIIADGKANTTAVLQALCRFNTTKRALPGSVDTSAMSTFQFETGATAGNTPTSIVLNGSCATTQQGFIDVTKTGSFTVGAYYLLMGYNNTGAYIGFSSEL